MIVLRWVGAVILWLIALIFFTAAVYADKEIRENRDDAIHSQAAAQLWAILFGGLAVVGGIALVMTS